MKVVSSLATGSLLVVPCLAYAVIKRIVGIEKTVELSEKLSLALRGIVNAIGKEGVSEQKTACAERWLRRFGNRLPCIACFEQACALQLWFAEYGETSVIVIGKSIQGGRLRMHAWVESGEKKYFYDDQFEAVWRSDELVTKGCLQPF